MSNMSWRSVAVVALLGWGGTALAWMQTAATLHPPAVQRAQVHCEGVRERLRPSRTTRLSAPLPIANAARDIDKMREDLRNEVLWEIEQERAERRLQRSQAHLDGLLDEVTAFVDEYDLDATTQAALESSLVAMHDHLEALRPVGPPPGPEGPPPEVLDAIETAFAQFREEFALALNDPDLADRFTEQLTPPPLRHRRQRI